MERWEYLEAYVYQDEWVDSTGHRQPLSNPIRMADAQVYFSSLTVLNELGKEGWDLVSVAFQGVSLYRLFLKRRADPSVETPASWPSAVAEEAILAAESAALEPAPDEATEVGHSISQTIRLDDPFNHPAAPAPTRRRARLVLPPTQREPALANRRKSWP